jgi:hypothetical protein
MSDENPPQPGDSQPGDSQPGNTPPPPPPPPTGDAYPPPQPGAYAPMPGGPPPPGSPAGRERLDVGRALSYGWAGFTANLGPVLLIVLAVVVVGVGVNALSLAFSNEFVSFLLSLVAFVVGLVIALGLIRAALTITDGAKPSIGEVFTGDGVVQYAIASIVLGAAFAVINFVGVITIILFPITFILTAVLGFFVQFFGYAIVDENSGAFEGIQRSFQLVRSNLGELILLWLVALGVNIVGALLCGVGLLVTIPLTAIAWAYAWRTLTGGQVAPQAS